MTDPKETPEPVKTPTTPTKSTEAKGPVHAPVQSADDRRAQTLKEYETWVAVEPIDLNGVRAFNVGDPVPVSHVERGVVDEAQVAKRNTKAALAAHRTASGIDDETQGE